MPQWEHTCSQPLTESGQARPCPCYFCNDCPNATLACKMGEQYCVKNYKGENIPTPFIYERAEDIKYQFIPTPFTRCAGCMYWLLIKTYNILETRPFDEIVEDLPF